MPGQPFNSVVPLPKQWNKRVRSSVLHVVSLAHLALTAARAQAIERHRAQTGHYGKLDRLRQELNLHREEMLLKDARLVDGPTRWRESGRSRANTRALANPRMD